VDRQLGNRSVLRGNIDLILLASFAGLVILGWMMQYALSVADFEPGTFFDFRSYVGRHTIWLGIAVFISFLIFSLNKKIWVVSSYPLYGLSIVLLILVLIFGVEINGTRSWFTFGPVNFQPSELAKLTTCLALSSLLATYRVNLKRTVNAATAIFVFLLPAILVIMQPDAGTSFIFFSFFIVLYRAGLNPGIYVLGIGLITLLILGLLFNPWQLWMIILFGISVNLLFRELELKYTIPLIILLLISILILNVEEKIRWAGTISIAILLGSMLWGLRKGAYRLSILSLVLSVVCGGVIFLSNFGYNNVLEKHQQDRINVWLKPSECDPHGSLYNLLQSKTAIASGGFSGKGFGKGTMTKFNYIPEQNTDFIFCTISEEQGFIGALALIILYTVLLMRLLKVAERQRNDFERFYVYGVVGVVFFHFIINIGMTMGLVPVVGIPLPFISYGGSSLIVFTSMIIIAMKIDSERHRV
jgi:rod shape determining protein RodA